MGAVSVVLTAALFLMGCFDSHVVDDAAMPPPGAYHVDPAPGEGTSCPSFPTPPPDCETRGAGLCDGDELRRAFLAARPGDVVRVGRCRVSAQLMVRAGVTLTGVDSDASIVAAPRGQPAIVLSAEASPSVARCLSVEPNETAGVLVQGPGGARVEHVAIRVETGLGIAAEGVGRLSLHSLDIAGPVTPANAGEQPFEPSPDVAATIGLDLNRVGEVTIYDTTITGFATGGMLAVNTAVTLRSVELLGNLGFGGMFTGAPVCARELRSEGTLQGTRIFLPYGLVLGERADFRGADVSVTGTEGLAILQDDSSLDVEALVLDRNRQGGLWVQDGRATDIRGARLVDNSFAGVYVCGASAISITDSEINRTESRVRIADTMPIEVGVGLAVGATANIHLADVRFVDNEIAGMVLDLATATAPEIDRVLVSGAGDAFGAVAFDDAGWLGIGGWDDGITREGAVERNDAAGAPGLPTPLGFGCPGLRM